MRKKFFIVAFIYLASLFSNTYIGTITPDFDQVTSVTLLASASALPVFPEERLLTVVLMVKDEQDAMEKTLKPLVDGGIQSFLIFDTGSTDRTIAVTDKFFKTHNIERACIVQESFVNFEVSRNRALDLAERVFPFSTFMLMPDAEWYLHNVEGLLKFCEQERSNYMPSYSIRLTNGYEDFRRTCVARVKSKTRYVGATHEVMIPETGSQVPGDVYFELCTTHYGQEKSRRRWVRDLDLLLKQYEKNSTPEHPDTRSMFYIAQTYACLDDCENAYRWYELRSQHHGWDEEDFITVYRLAQTAEQLSRTNDAYPWSLAQQHYIDAHKMRPHRIEPLIKLADYYWDVGNFAACYLFVKRASEIPYPEHDVLFVERMMYEFYRYEILSKCAWYVQEYAVGEWATRKALEVHPDQIHLHTNLGFYMSVKEKNDVCFAIN